VNDTGILNETWPADLDPKTVPFRKRTVTILRRLGFFDDPALLNEVTEADVLGWWYAGVKTVADLRDTGNAAIAAHHAGAPERRRQAGGDAKVGRPAPTPGG
jgi:Fe-S-cluster formation regulator IscX/YfhJ